MQTCFLVLSYEKPPAWFKVENLGILTINYPKLGPVSETAKLNLNLNGPVYPILNGNVY